MKVINNYAEISIENILPHPDNPRKQLGDLTELAESLKVNGFISNLTVVPLSIERAGEPVYIVIAGHRRLSAAKLAGIKIAPCKIVEMSQKEQLSMMLGENMQRNELTIKEQADGFQMMFDLGNSIEDISKLSGFTPQTVKHRLAIAKLESKSIERAMKNGLTLEDFAKLEKIEDVEARNKLLANNTHATISRAVDDYIRDKEISDFKQKLFSELEEHGAVELEDTSKAWSGDYKILKSYNLDSLRSGREQLEFPESDSQIYYSNDYVNWLYLRIKEDPEKKNAQEAARMKEKAENERRQAELNKISKQLNKDVEHFIDNIDETSKTLMLAYRCFIAVACIGCHSYRTYIKIDKRKICSAIDVDEFNVDEPFIKGMQFPNELLYQLQKRPARFFFKLTYKCFECDLRFHTKNIHNVSNSINAFISYVKLAGFNPDDEEKTYIDGTHTAYAKEN